MRRIVAVATVAAARAQLDAAGHAAAAPARRDPLTRTPGLPRRRAAPAAASIQKEEEDYSACTTVAAELAFARLEIAAAAARQRGARGRRTGVMQRAGKPARCQARRPRHKSRRLPVDGDDACPASRKAGLLRCPTLCVLFHVIATAAERVRRPIAVICRWAPHLISSPPVRHRRRLCTRGYRGRSSICPRAKWSCIRTLAVRSQRSTAHRAPFPKMADSFRAIQRQRRRAEAGADAALGHRRGGVRAPEPNQKRTAGP